MQNAGEYGAALSAMFFRDTGLKEAFSTALAVANRENALRVRLIMNPAVPGLHDILWETLEDPSQAAHAPLATSERVLVSRFLSSWDFRPVPFAPQGCAARPGGDCQSTWSGYPAG